MTKEIIPPSLNGRSNKNVVFLWLKLPELIFLVVMFLASMLISGLLISSTNNYWWICLWFLVTLIGVSLTLPVYDISLLRIICLYIDYLFSPKSYGKQNIAILENSKNNEQFTGEFCLQDGTKCAIYEIKGISVTNLSDEEIESLINELTQVFNHQINLNIYKLDIPWDIDKDLKYFQKDNNLAKKYFDFIDHQLPNKISKQIKQFLVIEWNNENIKGVIDDIKSILSNKQIDLLPINSFDQVYVMQKIFFNNINKINLHPKVIEVIDEKNQKEFFKFISIKRLSNFVELGWIDEILNIENLEIKIQIGNLPNKKIERKINLSINYYRSIINNSRTKDYERAESELYFNALNELNNEYTLKQNTIKTFSILFLIRAKTIKEIYEKTNRLERILRNKKHYVNSLITQQYKAFKSFVPFSVNTSLKNVFNVSSTTIAKGLPMLNSYFVEEKGLLFGIDQFNKSPVILNYDKTTSDKANNNINIIGSSGSGKTTMMSQIITNMLMTEKFRCFIIDPDRQFEWLAQKCNGEIIDISNNEQVSINPFGINVGESIDSKIDIIRGFFQIISQDSLSKIQIEKLIGIIHDFYVKNYDAICDGKTEQLTFSKLYQLIKLTNELSPDVKFTIKQYCQGETDGNLWDKPTKFNIKNDFTIFNIKNLPNDSIRFKAQIYLILRYLESQILENMMSDKNICLIIDEAHLFLNRNTINALQKLQNFSRRVRKYKASLIVGTQTLKDFLNKEIETEATALINNAETICIMRLKKEDQGNLKKLMGSELTDFEYDTIVHQKIGQCLLKRGNYHTNVDVLKIY